MHFNENLRSGFSFLFSVLWFNVQFDGKPCIRGFASDEATKRWKSWSNNVRGDMLYTMQIAVKHRVNIIKQISSIIAVLSYNYLFLFFITSVPRSFKITKWYSLIVYCLYFVACIWLLSNLCYRMARNNAQLNLWLYRFLIISYLL